MWINTEGPFPSRWLLYKHRTELLTGKCWKGHFSRGLNNSIPTPLPIRTVHKYPFSFSSKDLEGGLSTVPSRVGGTRNLVRLGKAEHNTSCMWLWKAVLSSAACILLPWRSWKYSRWISHSTGSSRGISESPFPLMHVFCLGSMHKGYIFFLSSLRFWELLVTQNTITCCEQYEVNKNLSSLRLFW